MGTIFEFVISCMVAAFLLVISVGGFFSSLWEEAGLKEGESKDNIRKKEIKGERIGMLAALLTGILFLFLALESAPTNWLPMPLRQHQHDFIRLFKKKTVVSGAHGIIFEENFKH